MAKAKKENKEAEVKEEVVLAVRDLGSDKERLLELHKTLTELRVTRIGDLEQLISKAV